MSFCCFILIASELFQCNYDLAGVVMTDILSKKEIIHSVILGIPKGIKIAVPITTAPGIEIFVKIKLHFRVTQNKTLFEKSFM